MTVSVSGVSSTPFGKESSRRDLCIHPLSGPINGTLARKDSERAKGLPFWVHVTLHVFVPLSAPPLFVPALAAPWVSDRLVLAPVEVLAMALPEQLVFRGAGAPAAGAAFFAVLYAIR